MKIFRLVLFIILCFAFILIAIGFVLPRKIHVERKLLISASQKTLFNQVNTLKNWVKWTTWLHKDTSMLLIYYGPESGVGAKLKWISGNKNVGKGSVSIISSVSADSLEVVFDFVEKGKSTGKFFFLNANQNTNVTYCIESDLGMNPISRWVGLFSDQLIGPEIEMGLFNLDQLVQDNKTIYGYEIIDYEVPGRILITARDTASPETVTTKLALMYKNISLFFKSKDLSPIGNPIAIFHAYSNRSFDIEAGLPVPSIVSVPEGLICSEKPAQKTVMIKYSGSYKLISSAYKALQAYIADNELQLNGPGWEEYITNPISEADSYERQTNIYFPVK
jgi:effector-binding domain-containing protein